MTCAGCSFSYIDAIGKFLRNDAVLSFLQIHGVLLSSLPCGPTCLPLLDKFKLVYEQDEVQLCIDDGLSENNIGKLRITERDDGPYIEWSQNFDDTADEEWALIASPNVAFSSRATSDSVTINNCKKFTQNISISVDDIHHCTVSDDKKNLELVNKCGENLGEFHFHSQHCGFFFDVLHRYVSTKQQDDDPRIYILQNKHQASIDDQLSALNLVPTRNLKHYHKHHHHHMQHWASDAPKKVWGFINSMKRDPYTTTLDTLSKVYDVVLYGDYTESTANKEDASEVAELLHNISGMDDLEPGYEILTKREQLAERPNVERLTPLTHEEFKTYVCPEGRINRVDALQQRIFRGGVHSNLRAELWSYLLGLYEWQSTFSEREERRKKKEQEYYVMKKQWKTISEEQERNFSGFKDRKSLIEKDVNRTDRCHPFYEGDSNSNLITLHDILMTFIMYNFDLGYVQGMSDLLAPILYVMQNEVAAFWCFVGYMERVYRNFDLDQSGMKQQLLDLAHILRILDPEFVSFLESQDSANLYFCFRWLLVRFKRELNYSDTLKLWEVLWTDYHGTNFHLCVAAAIFDTERNKIIEEKYGFTDILKHINGLSLRIDLDATLRKAEAIYEQLSNSPSVPNTVRSILGLPEIPKVTPKASVCIDLPQGGFPGHVERVSSGEANNSVPNVDSEEENLFEDAIAHSFL